MSQYDQAYFESMDGGVGYRDSTMWEDIAHTIKETFAIDAEHMKDHSSEIAVVEWGCARGYLVRHLRRRGFDAWGMDISKWAISHAPQDVKPYLRVFDMAWVDGTHFGDESFDLAVCFETMEHIAEEHVQRALGHIYASLRPSGYALFSICTDTRPDRDTDPTHQTIKSRLWWFEQLMEAGFHTTRDTQFRCQFLQSHWLFMEHDGVFVVTKL